MPTTTVRMLFNRFNIYDLKQVKWGMFFKELNEGVYVVSSSYNPDVHFGISDTPVFDDRKIEKWIELLPAFTVEGKRATLKNVKDHLTEFWFKDESILYIGKAPKRKDGSGIGKRVSEFYSTELGKGSPHSGGQWIKALKSIDSYTVYYGACNNPSNVEIQMLDMFMANVSQEALDKLYDKKLTLPFANIKYKGNKKRKFKNERL